MAISNYIPYEGDLVLGTIIQAADWNGMFDGIANYINGVLVPTINTLLGSIAGLPSGVMVPYFGTGPVPAGYALCNGQTTTWLTGPLAGTSVTTLNMIGMGIQGSDITGGSSTPNVNGWGATANQALVGNTNHTHAYSGTTSTATDRPVNIGTLAPDYEPVTGHQHTYSGTTNNGQAQPPAYGLPWILKL